MGLVVFAVYHLETMLLRLKERYNDDEWIVPG
jgi:hypothetical protein